jgi:protein-tyrosine phosphatase
LRYPLPCTFSDFEAAQLAVGLKEAEHRPLIEHRFPGLPNIIEYWDVDDIELASPSTALARIDDLVEMLITRLLAENC